MKDLSELAKGLAGKISQSNDAKIEAAQSATINKVKNEVVADAVKENLNVASMDDLATDKELSEALQSYVKVSDIFKSGYFYTKKDNNDGSYALLWNESDGGGSQYYNKTADIISYVGTNDGGNDGIAVQLYSKYKDGVGGTKNSGTRININPNGAYYTKGTNTSTNGGSDDNEIAVKADIKSSLTSYATKSYVSETTMATAVDIVDTAFNGNFTKIWKDFDINDNSKGYFYTKKNNNDGSYALLWNESDGGGSQYYNKTADIISYAGVNDGDENGICVQLYSKSYNGISASSLQKNEGVRINVNPHGAYYTKGINTSANGGSVDNEIAVKADIKTLQDRIESLESLVSSLQAALSNAVDINGNNVYTMPNV